MVRERMTAGLGLSSPIVDCIRRHAKQLEGLEEIRNYPAGVELTRQGVEAQEIFIVLNGRVKLVYSNKGGATSIIGLRASGSVLGAAEALLGERHHAAAVTSAFTEVARFAAGPFIDLVRSRNDFSVCLMGALSQEVYDREDQIIELSSISAEERLEHIIFKLASFANTGRSGNGTKLQLPLKQCEFAQLLSITPAYLCRLLARLENRGLICKKKGWIVTCGRPELRD